MSTVYNPEADAMQVIEQRELEAREIRRRIERVQSVEDRRVLNRQLHEIEEEIGFLQQRLPH